MAAAFVQSIAMLMIFVLAWEKGVIVLTRTLDSWQFEKGPAGEKMISRRT